MYRDNKECDIRNGRYFFGGFSFNMMHILIFENDKVNPREKGVSNSESQVSSIRNDLDNTTIYMNGADYKVLLYILYAADNGSNILKETQAIIARNLGIHRSTVSRSIEKLCNIQVLAITVNGNIFINPLLYSCVGRKRNKILEMQEEFETAILKKFEGVRFVMDEDGEDIIDNGVFQRHLER